MFEKMVFDPSLKTEMSKPNIGFVFKPSLIGFVSGVFRFELNKSIFDEINFSLLLKQLCPWLWWCLTDCILNEFDICTYISEVM